MITEALPADYCRLIHGDCIDVLRKAPAGCIDLAVTDPPYIVRFRDRSGRTITSDDRSNWILPAYREIFRVLKNDSFCVSFYGWNHAEKFVWAWKKAGFRVVGHIVFVKNYASRVGFLGARHEQAMLLIKGEPAKPKQVLKDVLPWRYSGNQLHPTQKPVAAILPLIQAFSQPGGLVLDPFAGSATTLIAARELGRRAMGIGKDLQYYEIARQRLFPSS
jgi:adenine-specific DNA-methyltransferase